MKTLQWQNFLEEQSSVYGKKLFTVTELANVANTSPQSLNVELSRLKKRGVIEQYTYGKYGLPKKINRIDLLKSIDSRAYITSISALFYHGLITQVPKKIICFTNRRHNRSRIRQTPVGHYVFICVSRAIYNFPAEEPIALPEQALLDYVYLMRRKNVQPERLVTFRSFHTLSKSKIFDISKHYPHTVTKHVNAILKNYE
jgi:hypothetical protein